MGLVGDADYADAVAEEQFYKQMVCEGKWPDYKNLGVDCEDIQERVSSLSEAFGIHYDTMRKYLRQWELYGESIYTPNPQYVEKTED
jgi:hypothetical protein